MRPSTVALLCAVIPFFAVHLTYISNIFAGVVPVCIPYLEGCLSISRAARSGESIYIFRALMMPMSVFFAAYWFCAYAWLKMLKGDADKGDNTMLILGSIGALFLILYVTYLGTDGETYRWMRRYGVTVFFSFTALAQILFLQRLMVLEKTGVLAGFTIMLKAKFALCVTQWSIGLLSLPVDFVFHEKSVIDAVQNIVEWNFAIAMNVYFFVSFLIFKRAKIRFNLASD